MTYMYLPVCSILLQHLVTHYDSIRGRLEPRLFQDTLQTFSVTNEELEAKGSTGVEGYQSCVDSCKVRGTNVCTHTYAHTQTRN